MPKARDSNDQLHNRSGSLEVDIFKTGEHLKVPSFGHTRLWGKVFRCSDLCMQEPKILRSAHVYNTLKWG